MTDFTERLRSAADRVSRHCFNKAGDTALMTIPADPQRDVDLLLCQAADEIERLRVLLRELLLDARDMIRAGIDDYDGVQEDALVGRIDAALAGAAVQPSSPADGQPVAEGVARAEVVPYPYGEGRTDQPSAALTRDAARYRWLRVRASQSVAYDRYGDGCHWSIGFFSEDSRKGFDAAVDENIPTDPTSVVHGKSAAVDATHQQGEDFVNQCPTCKVVWPDDLFWCPTCSVPFPRQSER